MPAATYDLYIEQGTTLRFTGTYARYDGTTNVDGSQHMIPYDLSDCQIRMQIRQRPGAPVLASATTRNGGIVIDPDPTTGRFIVTLTDELTDTFTIGRARWDCEVSFPSGDVLRILQGKVTISPNITMDADRADILTGIAPAKDVDEMDVDLDTKVTDQPSTAY